MKTIFTIIVLLAAAGGIFYYAATWQARPVPPVEEEPVVVAQAEYFQEQMFARGVADIGQPIEGFDANLLKVAFPGLLSSDFIAVAAFEGHYELGTSTTADPVFVRDTATAISSAERTVSAAGYETLLANLSLRLGLPVSTEGEVDTLIDSIDTGERIQVRINERASVGGVAVTPRAVLEDSRCPVDVECVQFGRVRKRALLESGLGSTEQEFVRNQPITTEAELVELIQVAPNPESDLEIAPEDYVFTFSILIREDA